MVGMGASAIASSGCWSIRRRCRARFSSSWALTQSGFSDALAQAAQVLPGGKWGFLAASIVGYYSACAVGKVDPNEGVGPMLRYALALFVGVVIIALVPWFSVGFLH
jgi:hypothetical protein